MEYNKSPLNYIGNKYQILPQLMPLFPENIDTFVDLFMGGGDVITNVQAHKKIGIEINSYVTDIFYEFQKLPLAEILAFMERRIAEFNLTKENEIGYLAYRDAYNTKPEYHTPLDLFTLSRYSFHFTMRFNADLQMNAGFGRGFSNFSSRQRKTIGPFHAALRDIEINNKSFVDFQPDNSMFLYADPPYLITNNVYNHGIRQQVNQKWTKDDEIVLLNYLENAHQKGIKFALSNVLHHRGKINTFLDEWIHDNPDFIVHNIYNAGYSHCTHTVSQNDPPTEEIVVTNYRKEN